MTREEFMEIMKIIRERRQIIENIKKALEEMDTMLNSIVILGIGNLRTEHIEVLKKNITNLDNLDEMTNKLIEVEFDSSVRFELKTIKERLALQKEKVTQITNYYDSEFAI